MDEVTVIPNFGVTSNNEPVPAIQTTSGTTTETQGCTGEHTRRGRSRSGRAIRTTQATNFMLYGITLMIPGVAMIIVYFVVFRIPAGNVKWSPADAFVITGAVLIGFSIVSEVIGFWQFCMSRMEPDEDTTQTTTRNNQYSDAPPSYDRIAIALPDLVAVPVSNNEPPSFDSCLSNKRLPGIENRNSEDPPPPAYVDAAKYKKVSPEHAVVIFNTNIDDDKLSGDKRNSSTNKSPR